MLPDTAVDCSRNFSVFQSAPGFLAGRNPLVDRGANRIPFRFNPLPAFWPGETSTPPADAASRRVSIRSRLFGREKRLSPGVVQLTLKFQSAPGFLAGRNQPRPGVSEAGAEFQSAPGFLAGRNADRAQQKSQSPKVSIRSRLFGREKLKNNMPAIRPSLFQSAPGFLAGRNPWLRACAAAWWRFQSAPGFLAGRNLVFPSFYFITQVFQSAPGFLAGRNH